MKYIVLVSHGEFADGLRNALTMLAGDREDLISAGLEDGTSADEFAKKFEKAIAPVEETDEILLLGDLIGGSPLTTACNVISEKGLAENTRVIGGMNLPTALTALLTKDAMDLETLKETVIGEGSNALREFQLTSAEEEDEI